MCGRSILQTCSLPTPNDAASVFPSFLPLGCSCFKSLSLPLYLHAHLRPSKVTNGMYHFRIKTKQNPPMLLTAYSVEAKLPSLVQDPSYSTLPWPCHQSHPCSVPSTKSTVPLASCPPLPSPLPSPPLNSSLLSLTFPFLCLDNWRSHVHS